MEQPVNLDNPIVAAMLQSLQSVFHEHGVGYFLVGALARDIQLSARGAIEARRKTNDVDIAILVDAAEHFYLIKQTLLNSGEFEEAERNDIKLIFRSAIEVDILPFGAIENEHREIRLSRNALLIMDMHGFQEVYPFVQEHTLANGLSLKVCSLEGLVLLKLFANADNPSRSKDITDIEHLIEVYFELNSDEIYTDYFNTMDLYNTSQPDYLQLVSARVIGRKINQLLSNSIEGKQKMQGILSSRPSAKWEAILYGLSD